MDPLLPDEEHGGLVEDSDDELTPRASLTAAEMEEQEMTAIVKTAVETMIATDLRILAEAMIAAGRQSSPPETMIAAEGMIAAGRQSSPPEPEPDVPPEPKPDVQPPPLKKRRIRGKQKNTSADSGAAASLPPQVPRRRTEMRAHQTGLSENEVRALMHVGWPIACFNCLAMIFGWAPPLENDTRSIYCVEFFSGVSMVAGTFQLAGFASQTYDICTHHLMENLNTPEGLCTAMKYAMLLKKHGLAHFATVCSAWIFLSMGTTKRSADNLYWGCTDRPSVRTANAQVVRMILVIMLLRARGCSWILEQPMTSLMCKVPLWRAVAPAEQIYKTSTWMGAYGAPTRKPTWLLSTEQWTTNLARTLKRDAPLGVEGTTVKMADTIDGRSRVCGGPRLKESQAYPEEYGKAVHENWWHNYKAHNDGDICDVSDVASSVSDTDYMEISTEHGEIKEACDGLGVRSTSWMC